MFIASLISDLVKGMTHLHYKTNLACHGNLKSSNCVITSRWVLKITDYGLHELRNSSEQESISTGEHEHYRSKLYDTLLLLVLILKDVLRQFLSPFSITYINKLRLSSFGERFKEKEGTIYMKKDDILRFLEASCLYSQLQGFSFDTGYIFLQPLSKLSLFSFPREEVMFWFGLCRSSMESSRTASGSRCSRRRHEESWCLRVWSHSLRDSYAPGMFFCL